MGILKKYLSKNDLLALAEKITEVERDTIGEIRVSIVRSRSWRERSLTIEQLALRDFHRLGMQKTNAQTGVLLLVVLYDRQFHIAADRGINDKISAEEWQRISDRLVAKFKEGEYRVGLLQSIDDIGRILIQHFPSHAGDTNELTNSVDVR